MIKNAQYEVALSFAGEQRYYVEGVARALQSRGIAVFYDEFEKIAIWGKSQTEEFHDVFENRANSVVMFISKEYVTKVWPNFERQAIISRAVKERQEYVLPFGVKARQRNFTTYLKIELIVWSCSFPRNM